MWQEIITKAKDNLTGEIQNQAGVSQQEAEKSINLTKESIQEVLTQEAKQGNVQAIMELFRSRNLANSGNPLMQKITNKHEEKLISQLNIPLDRAKKVQSIALPYLLNLLNQQTGGTDTPPNLQHLTDLLGGAESLPEDVKEKLKKYEGSF